MLAAVAQAFIGAARDHLKMSEAASGYSRKHRRYQRMNDPRPNERESAIAIVAEPRPHLCRKITRAVECACLEAAPTRLIEHRAGRREDRRRVLVRQTTGGCQRHTLGAVKISAMQNVEQRHERGATDSCPVRFQRW